MKFAGLLMLRRGRDSQAPADAFSATGLSGALLRLDIATASTPRKNAVRRMAPRLPGLSCGSGTCQCLCKV